MAEHRLASLIEVRRYLEVAVKKDPENMVATRFPADLLDRSSEWQGARYLYERVVAREPRNAWALYGLGHTLIALVSWPGTGGLPLSLATRVERPTVHAGAAGSLLLARKTGASSQGNVTSAGRWAAESALLQS
jgi:hypothetical protein